MFYFAGFPRITRADALPPSVPDNTFHVYAIWDAIMGAPEEQIRSDMDEMLRRFGPGNAFHKPYPGTLPKAQLADKATIR